MISLHWIVASKFKLFFKVLMQIFQIFSIYFCKAKMQKSSYSFKKLHFSYFSIKLGSIGTAVYGIECTKFLWQRLPFTYFLPNYRVTSWKIYSCKYCARPVLSIYLNTVICENFSRKTSFLFNLHWTVLHKAKEFKLKFFYTLLLKGSKE